MIGMYEDYLTKALAGIIVAKQAVDNYELTKIKDIKNTAALMWKNGCLKSNLPIRKNYSL